MNKKEIGHIEARLHEIEFRDMRDKQRDEAIEDMAGYMLALIDEIKTIKSLIGYIEHDNPTNIIR